MKSKSSTSSKSSTILNILEEGNEVTRIPSKTDSDVIREEELWSSDNTKFLVTWSDEMEIKAKKHDANFTKYKARYNALSIPTILLPLLCSPLTSYIEKYPMITSLTLICTGMLSGINSFFNYSKKAQKNDQYSNLYSQLSREIKTELRHPSRFRMPVDKFSERVYQKYSSLDSSAPK